MDLQATFDQLPVGIAHSDQGGHILGFNTTFCTMLGFQATELADKTFAQITYPDDLDKSSAELERLWRGEIASYTLEKRYVRKSGEITWIRVTAALVRDRNGTIESAVGILEDISARRLAQEQLARLHQETLAASRQAGKAEVAADVLHNLGNALNSVNVSAGLIGLRLKQSKAATLRQIAALLNEHGQDLDIFFTQDDLGKHLRRYLAQLAAHRRSTRSAQRACLASRKTRACQRNRRHPTAPHPTRLSSRGGESTVTLDDAPSRDRPNPRPRHCTTHTLSRTSVPPNAHCYEPPTSG